MKPIDQFMQEFFDESVQFHRKYYDLFPEIDRNIESLESAKDFNDFAIAITRSNGGTHYMRRRYRLRPAGETWKIVEMKFQCGRCGGTGKKPESDETCPKCNGELWI